MKYYFHLSVKITDANKNDFSLPASLDPPDYDPALYDFTQHDDTDPDDVEWKNWLNGLFRQGLYITLLDRIC